MIGKRVFATLAVVVGILWASPASAQGSASCSISTTPVNFGNYNVYSATALDSTGTITYNCNKKLSITITLAKGVSGTYSPRTMKQGAEPLTYNLYTDAARSIVWGDGTGGTSVHSNPDAPKDTNVVLTIYGRVPASQDVSAGAFLDTLIATINF